MKNFFYILTSLAVMGLVFWAYRENYGTQHAIKQVTRLQHEIAGLKENLGMQRAEWAYLNRPARLRALALLNFERLKLVPLAPDQFGDVSQIPYPTPGEYDDKTADGGAAGSRSAALDPKLADPKAVAPKNGDPKDKDGQYP